MTLAVEEYPRPGAPTIVLVHGFTQNTRCWGDLPQQLNRRFRVLAVDAPGHGSSPARHDDAGPAEAARLIGEVGGQARYLGYSMGGRLCLQLACDRPDLVEELVLVGATPGLTSPDARETRNRADAALADRLEREGLDAFLEHWLSLPLFAGLDEAGAARPARLRNRPEGVAASLRCCGTGRMEPLWDRLSLLTMPVLLLAGASDTKFATEAEAMAASLHHATGRVDGRAGPALALVQGAGHTAHLEQPGRFLALLEDWWQTRDGVPGHS